MSNAILIFFIMSLTTVGYVATDIYLPSLPAITQYFETSNTLVQFTLTVYLLSFALSPLIFGPYSDKVGRRSVILGGMMLGLIATFCISLAQSIVWLILFRFVQGFALGAVNVAARAMIADNFRGKKMAKISALSGMVIPVILSSVPPIGGILQELYGWQMVFYALFLYLAFVTLLCVYWLKESNHDLKVDVTYRKSLTDYKSLVINTDFMVYALIPGFTMFGISAYLTASPYLFQHLLLLSPSEYGYVSFLIGAMVVSGSVVNINLINYVSAEKILYISAFMILLSAVSLAGLHFWHFLSVQAVVAACMAYFFSLNFAFANSVSLAYKHISHNFGTATAWVASMQMLMGMVSSVIISVLPESDVLPMMAMFFVAGIGVLVLTWIGHRRAAPQ